MEAIQTLLLDVPRDKRADGCSDGEITDFCQAYKRLLQYFDLLSSYCYRPYGSIVDSEMEDIRRLVGMMDRLFRKLCRNVPPKVQGWQHLLEDLEKLRGMKWHQEAKIELAHQDGRRKTDLRFRAMKENVKKKIKYALQYQANMNDQATRAKQKEFRKARARKFTQQSIEARQGALDSKKRAKQFHAGELLGLPEINKDFPFVLELAVRDRLAIEQGM